MVYTIFIVSLLKKMKLEKFRLQVLTVCFKEKKRFKYKNNYCNGKLAKFSWILLINLMAKN